MRHLLINDEVRLAIAEARRAAGQHVIPQEVLQALKGPAGSVVNLKIAFVEIPQGFRVGLTLEDQPNGLIRHLSVQIPDVPGRWPSPEAVQMIMEAFGFQGRLGTPAVEVWTVKASESVHVGQPIWPTYELGPESITCHRCGMVSYHPKDRENLYCGNCQVFHPPAERVH